MWDGQFETFARSFRVLRYDCRGFGRSEIPPVPYSHREDLRALLDHVGMERAAIVGLSMGGGVEVEFALEHPERVSALVLVAVGLPGHDWSQELRSYWDEEEAAIARGDIDAAVEMNLRIWVDGPKRGRDTVDPAVREKVREMTARGFEIANEAATHQDLDPPPGARLSQIRVPTLIITGDLDVSDIQRIARELEAAIAGARREVIAGAAHMVNMERPQEFNRLVLDFLAGP